MKKEEIRIMAMYFIDKVLNDNDVKSMSIFINAKEERFNFNVGCYPLECECCEEEEEE